MAIQREIDKRTGLKGRASKFMFPVSESKFSGDRVMFNDTGSVSLEYSLDNNVHIQKKLKMGAYSTRIITFNPYNCYYEVINPNAGTTEKGEENTPGDQKKLKLGGKELPALNKEFDFYLSNAKYMRDEKNYSVVSGSLDLYNDQWDYVNEALNELNTLSDYIVKQREEAQLLKRK